jgi:hypothetical protein
MELGSKKVISSSRDIVVMQIDTIEISFSDVETDE